MSLSKVVHHLSRDRANVCNTPCSGPCYRLLAPAGTICSGEAAAGPSQQIYLDIYTDIYTAASNFINISKYFLSRFSLVSVSCLFISSFIYSFLQHTSSLAAKWEEVTVCQLPAANLSWQLLCWWSCPNILIDNEIIIHLCIILYWIITFRTLCIDFYQPTNMYCTSHYQCVRRRLLWITQTMRMEYTQLWPRCEQCSECPCSPQLKSIRDQR